MIALISLIVSAFGVMGTGFLIFKKKDKIVFGALFCDVHEALSFRKVGLPTILFTVANSGERIFTVSGVGSIHGRSNPKRAFLPATLHGKLPARISPGESVSLEIPTQMIVNSLKSDDFEDFYVTDAFNKFWILPKKGKQYLLEKLKDEPKP